MKRFYLVRHGQTVGNIGKYFQFPETELAENGHKGGRAVAERFKEVAIDHILASNYKRAQQTAGYISKMHDIPITTIESLHELERPLRVRGMSHVSEEGEKHKREYREQFWADDYNEEGAENYTHVIERAKDSLDAIEKYESDSVVAVSHTDFIRFLTAYLVSGKSEDATLLKTIYYNLNPMFNVGITEFEYWENDWRLDKWNDYAHFAE